ncbi:hypothetical protein HAX54_015887 [Datura stramonium]|uniref:Uncharacterized protein n=1 Tax=Datura stramonium TaxID=4076 RepID=A0ABS8RZJ0_DATST|nr:hypothetical protein [Datura stramonium]
MNNGAWLFTGRRRCGGYGVFSGRRVLAGAGGRLQVVFRGVLIGSGRGGRLGGVRVREGTGEGVRHWCSPATGENGRGWWSSGRAEIAPDSGSDHGSNVSTMG